MSCHLLIVCFCHLLIVCFLTHLFWASLSFYVNECDNYSCAENRTFLLCLSFLFKVSRMVFHIPLQQENKCCLFSLSINDSLIHYLLRLILCFPSSRSILLPSYLEDKLISPWFNSSFLTELSILTVPEPTQHNAVFIRRTIRLTCNIQVTNTEGTYAVA